MRRRGVYNYEEAHVHWRVIDPSRREEAHVQWRVIDASKRGKAHVQWRVTEIVTEATKRR